MAAYARQFRMPPHRRGQVMIITLLALALLVGLVFYVYNIGDTVNRRMDLQSAADATANAGATWMARSMNVIAADNIGQVRMICLAAVLDSLPLAAEMAVAEEETANKDSLTKGLEKQLQTGIPNTNVERYDFLRIGLNNLYQQMLDTQTKQSTQMDALKEIDRALNCVEERDPENGAIDVRAYTYWQNGGGSEPTGKIWQAAKALDELSQATAASAGVLAQHNAKRMGESNQADVAILGPILPALPAKRGSFQNFAPVLLDSIIEINAPDMIPPRVQHSLAPSNIVNRLQNAPDFLEAAETARVSGGAIPDYQYPQRLGPWARLYRWRNGAGSGGHWDHTSTGVPEYDNGSRGFNPVPGFTIGYSTYGPMEWALQRVIYAVGLVGQLAGPADSSRFVHHLRRIATVKLAFIFGVTSPRDVQYAEDWMTDFDKVKAFVNDKTKPNNIKQILRTQYYRATVKSSRKWDDGNWLRIPSEYNGNIGPLNSPPTPPAPNAAMWVWPSDRAVNHWFDIEAYLAARYGPMPPYPRILAMKWYDVPGKFDASGQPVRARFPSQKLMSAHWERMTNFVWRVQLELEVDEDFDLNLVLKQKDTGEPIYHNTYSVGWYVFRGSELRNPVTLNNPGNWSAGADLPAPLLLDTQMGDYDPNSTDPDAGGRRATYTFLGAVRKKLVAPAWPGRFSPTVSDPVTAFAQAKLFNNKSWDLWTQDWQVQLMPVTQWSDWKTRLHPTDAQRQELLGVLNEQHLLALEEFLNYMPADGLDQYVKH